MATPAANITDKEYYNRAYAQAAAEFARCAGSALEGELLDEFQRIFNETIGNAIMNNGVKWEEPLVSYGLRHICKIGRRAAATTDCGDVSNDNLRDAAEHVIKQAQKACKATGGEIGVLCPG